MAESTYGAESGTGIAYYELAKKSSFSRECRVTKEPLALGAVIPWIHGLY